MIARQLCKIASVWYTCFVLGVAIVLIGVTMWKFNAYFSCKLIKSTSLFFRLFFCFLWCTLKCLECVWMKQMFCCLFNIAYVDFIHPSTKLCNSTRHGSLGQPFVSYRSSCLSQKNKLMHTQKTKTKWEDTKNGAAP